MELEDAVAAAFGGAVVLDARSVSGGDLSGVVVLVARLHSIRREDMRLCVGLRRRGARVVLYVFDAWGLADRLRRREHWGRRFVERTPSLSECCDLLCLPFRREIEALAPGLRRIARHVPLGVDTTLAGEAFAERPPVVLAYGRQPPDVTAVLSRAMNRPGAPTLFLHTDHMEISGILDPYAHRRQFWRMAAMSRIALAFDGDFGGRRARYPAVTQRWFECWAAGCVVVGRAPRTDEFPVLAPWPDAQIEAPSEAADLPDFLMALMADGARLARASAAAAAQARARHDWRDRFAPILAECGLFRLESPCATM
jgi:hypothetical protein